VREDDRVRRLRARIDTLDSEILRLLNERARCALEIGEVKLEMGRGVYDPAREKEILERVEGASAGPLEGAAVRRLFERILDESRRLERLGRSAEGSGDRGRNRGREDER
jgi:chorismate mutase